MKPAEITHEHIKAKIRSRVDLRRAGLSSNKIAALVRNGTLYKLRRCYYIEQSFYAALWPSQKAFAQSYAYYLAYPETVQSHQSAAYLHGLPVVRWDGHTHILCQRGSNTNQRGVKKHSVALLEDTPVVISSEGVLCTSVARTIRDCATVFPLPQAVALADHALYTGKITLPTLEHELLNYQGYSSRKVQEILQYCDPQSESIGESLTRIEIQRSGLPRPASQVPVVIYGQYFRIDLAYEDLKIAIEFDGRLKRTDFGPEHIAIGKERDREKKLLNAGWLVIRVDWETITRFPERFIAELRAKIALARR